MRSTAKYGIVVPGAGTDPDDVPTHLGSAMDTVDGLLGVPFSGTLSSRPAAGKVGREYFVTSGPSAGLLYRDNGAGWDQVNVLPGPTGNVATLGWGDTPNAGTPSLGYAPIDHDHGTQSNPVVPHVAASNPHPQYELASASRYKGAFDYTQSYQSGDIVTGYNHTNYQCVSPYTGQAAKPPATYVGGSATYMGTTPGTVALPTGTAVGDYMFIEMVRTNVPAKLPAGFTVVTTGGYDISQSTFHTCGYKQVTSADVASGNLAIPVQPSPFNGTQTDCAVVLRVIHGLTDFYYRQLYRDEIYVAGSPQTASPMAVPALSEDCLILTTVLMYAAGTVTPNSGSNPLVISSSSNYPLGCNTFSVSAGSSNPTPAFTVSGYAPYYKRVALAVPRAARTIPPSGNFIPIGPSGAADTSYRGLVYAPTGNIASQYGSDQYVPSDLLCRLTPGGEVQLTGIMGATIASSSAGPQTTDWTLPVGYRPAAPVWFTAFQVQGSNTSYVWVQMGFYPDGTIKVYYIAGGSYPLTIDLSSLPTFLAEQ